jgi:hypothetical protein
LLLALSLAASINQASGQASPQDLTCHHSVRDPQQSTRALDGGLTLAVRRNADPGASENACVVEVRDSSGQMLFSREGYSARVLGETGRDVDNDGFPDLVIGHDATSGGRCCREYSILSLRPALRVLGTFSNPSFESDASRRTVVWSTLPVSGLGPDMAQAPSIAIVGQYRDGRFVDITLEHCPAILAGTARGLANLSQDLWQLEGSRRAASRAEKSPPSFEVETTRISAITVVLQMMYCDRDADARELIRQVWPAAEQEQMGASIAAAVTAVRRR